MISDLFCVSGKQEDLQYRVNEQIPIYGLQVRTRGLSMFGRVGLKKKHFCFEKRECDSVPALMISRQSIGLLMVIVCRYGSTSTG